MQGAEDHSACARCADAGEGVVEHQRAVGEVRQDRHEEDRHPEPGIGGGPHRREPGGGGRRAGLERLLQRIVEDGDRHRDRHGNGCRGIHQQRQVAAQERALREDGEGRAALRQGSDDPGHERVATFRPLVRIGVRAEGDRLTQPGRLRELAAQHVADVRLHDDLPIEIGPGVEVEIRVRVPGEAVVTDDPTRDEVPCAGRDVDHLDIDAEVFDRHDVKISRCLHRFSRKRELSRDGRPGDVEEAASRRESAGKTHRDDAGGARRFDPVGQVEEIERVRDRRDELGTLVGDAQDAT